MTSDQPSPSGRGQGEGVAPNSQGFPSFTTGPSELEFRPVQSNLQAVSLHFPSPCSAASPLRFPLPCGARVFVEPSTDEGKEQRSMAQKLA